MQRKNNYHVNDIKVENLSCVCEWGNFRNDKHQVICMKLARVISTVNVILSIQVPQGQEKYHYYTTGTITLYFFCLCDLQFTFPLYFNSPAIFGYSSSNLRSSSNRNYTKFSQSKSYGTVEVQVEIQLNNQAAQ